MKRFLLSSLLVLALGRTAFGYVNNGIVMVPTMNPDLIQIDDPVFVNNGTFTVDLTPIQSASTPAIYTTSDTLYYTNNGVLIGIPGFDFENFPASTGQAQMSAAFVNNNNGIDGGVIAMTNGTFFIINGVLGSSSSPRITVRATNVIDSGLITLDNSGLIDIGGQDLDLRRGRFVMSNPLNTIIFQNGLLSTAFSQISTLDYGFSKTNQFERWQPSIQLTPTTASTPEFRTQFNFANFMSLTNATVYFQSNSVGSNSIVWQIVYLQDNSPSNVTKNVFFDDPTFGDGGFIVEWEGFSREGVSGQFGTNFFYLFNDPVERRVTNNYVSPPDFSFFESTIRQVPPGTLASTPGYANPAPPGSFTNDFSYLSLRPIAAAVDTNTVVGGSVTNLPGRIQFKASGSLNLANARITGPNYVSLTAPVNFLGNSNAVIYAPYSDLNLGVTNNSLTLSNLLVPQLPSWGGVVDAPSAVFGTEMGGLQTWSGSYFFVDANGATNDVRVLLINSALRPSTPALQQNVFLHATNSLVISDALNIFGRFGSDAAKLTLTSNDNSAFSLAGELNLNSPDIFWGVFTNLQYLTNYGRISTENLTVFAGNVFSPNSDLSLATPYQAFVNHGTIINQGTFIRANYFENTGTIQENLNNGLDIGTSGGAIVTNSQFIAALGPISIAANSLFLSNSIINAGQSLTLNVPCSLSDGYVFGNQFGHITNSILPNVVTNGNIIQVGAGIHILIKPPTADLLGTTITNTSLNGLDSITLWPGEDRGCSPGGYATNLALGRLILTADANPSQFTFASLNGSNALYVDSIEFQGSVTNTDGGGNFLAITIPPGMKIYYAQALMNGVSIAEKLNGKNGGGFCWVSNYAGVYSSTNIPYPDGNTYIFNAALAISPDIASGGPDGSSSIVNVNNPTPIPTNEIFDVVNIGPMPCDLGGTPPVDPNPTNSPEARVPSYLQFPTRESDPQAGGQSVPVSFTDAVGAYNGLFYETNGVKPTTSGSFTAKVTARGGFSAKLALGGKTYSFSKTFDGAGSFSNSVTSKGLPALTVVLQLVNNDEIEGTVSGDGWSAELLAYRATFTSKNPAPADWIGKNTALLTSDLEASTLPAGDAFGTASLSKAGAVQWSGVLPDGTKISQKSAISTDGVWPLYSSLYGNTGTLIGWLSFTNGDVDLAGHAVWLAPAGKSGLNLNGITNKLVVTGSSVTGSAGPLVSSTITLDRSLTNSVTISGKKIQSDNPTMKLSINLKTGLYNGTVTDPDSSQKLSFQGALLEKSGIGGGFFLNADKNQGGKVSLVHAD